MESAITKDEVRNLLASLKDSVRRLTEAINGDLVDSLACGETILACSGGARWCEFSIQSEWDSSISFIVLVLEADSIIGVERAWGMTVLVQIDIKANLVEDALWNGIAIVMKKSGHNRAALDKDSLVKIFEVSSDSGSSHSLNLLRVVIIPHCARRKSESNLLHLKRFESVSWCSDLGCNKHWVTEHELGFHSVEITQVWEFEPHRAHERLTSLSSSVERGIEIVDHVVSSV